MTKIPEEDGWIAWTGGRQPVDGDVKVQIHWFDGFQEIEAEGTADEFWWEIDGTPEHPLDGDIIAYRVVSK